MQQYLEASGMRLLRVDGTEGYAYSQALLHEYCCMNSCSSQLAATLHNQHGTHGDGPHVHALFASMIK
jgi:hypothetical protein